MVATLLYIVLGLIETFIAARFVLLFLGANSSSDIVSWIYAWSQPFVAPFAGIFGQHVATTGPGIVTTSVFDWTALIALIIYAIIGGIIVRLLSSLGN